MHKMKIFPSQSVLDTSQALVLVAFITFVHFTFLLARILQNCVCHCSRTFKDLRWQKVALC